MTMHPFINAQVHPSWHPILEKGLSAIDPTYLSSLKNSSQWLPGPEKIFNAFSMPVQAVRYILFGESPYPRAISANGFAFWDAAVAELWSETGLSKPVNRATSLRNFIKMLLLAEGELQYPHLGQEKIATLDKKYLIKTNEALFTRLIKHGFLLLNATLVLQPQSPRKDAKAWQPFMAALLEALLKQRPSIQLILFGNIANTIDKLLPATATDRLYAEHPYNISFINNRQIIKFFQPFHLLKM